MLQGNAGEQACSHDRNWFLQVIDGLCLCWLPFNAPLTAQQKYNCCVLTVDYIECWQKVRHNKDVSLVPV